MFYSSLFTSDTAQQTLISDDSALKKRGVCEIGGGNIVCQLPENGSAESGVLISSVPALSKTAAYLRVLAQSMLAVLNSCRLNKQNR